jgi:uncharacterized protein
MPAPVAAPRSSMLTRTALAVGAVGATCVAYGVFVEHGWYREQRYTLAVLPPASSPLTLLHLSDLHFVRGDRRKARFLASLPRPDVTVVTGDFLADPAAVETAVAGVHPVRGSTASLFVLGSNDYFAPQPINPLGYLLPDNGRRHGVPGRSKDLLSLLGADGWTYLKNERTAIQHDGVRLEVLGLDDPHIRRHDLRTASRTETGDFSLALVHSPDPGPELVALGYQLVLAGHTHGGQVRLPFLGALVTNGSTPTRLAMGLARLGPAYLHVSPGLGTSRYAPFRFLCRPEATYLRLVAGPERAPATLASGRNGT